MRSPVRKAPGSSSAAAARSAAVSGIAAARVEKLEEDVGAMKRMLSDQGARMARMSDGLESMFAMLRGMAETRGSAGEAAEDASDAREVRGGEGAPGEGLGAAPEGGVPPGGADGVFGGADGVSGARPIEMPPTGHNFLAG